MCRASRARILHVQKRGPMVEACLGVHLELAQDRLLLLFTRYRSSLSASVCSTDHGLLFVQTDVLQETSDVVTGSRYVTTQVKDVWV